jgi:hypothetical protein
MINFLILLVSIIAIGYFKAKADSLAHSGHFEDTVIWKNKWRIVKKQKRNGYKGDTDFLYYFPIKCHSYKVHWWYLWMYKPEYIEKFPFSSTVLVFLTDKWHLYNFFQYRFTHLAIVQGLPISIFNKIGLYFTIWILQGIIFELNYANKNQ